VDFLFIKEERFQKEARPLLDKESTPDEVGSARGNQGAAGSFGFFLPSSLNGLLPLP
jgi:hypothetical protein